MIDVFDIISKISAKKIEEGHSPEYALFSEICMEVTNQLKKEINRLIVAKKIRHHQTLNSFSFEVLENSDKKD